ncbi:MAG: class I SAM-dependent methyltransferase [Acidobacteriota bacterium]|nr:class I SAM-dependent methyltransferase [Acidobacteriota bacterium]
MHSCQTVADVGAGTGYFSLPLADAVGLQGKVYAVDAQNEMLALLRHKLDDAAILNVELIHAEAGNTTLPTGSCDLFFAANVWHEFDDCDAVLREAARALKPGGLIAILDWQTDAPPEPGPPLNHRLHSSTAVDALRFGGFQNIEVANVGLYSWLVQGEITL